MKRREFLQLSGLSGAIILLTRLGWPVPGTAVSAEPADNSSKPLIAIPFAIAAKGVITPPPTATATPTIAPTLTSTVTPTATATVTPTPHYDIYLPAVEGSD